MLSTQVSTLVTETQNKSDGKKKKYSQYLHEVMLHEVALR